MSHPADGDVTRLLKQWRTGDEDAEAQLFELVLPDLHRLARYFMRRERPGHTLGATALLNETYLRLVNARDQNWQNRRHFFALAARAMRRYLIDHARARPNAIFVTSSARDRAPVRQSAPEIALAVDRLLDTLKREHPDRAAIVEFKFFLGMTDAEAAEALGWPVRTAQRRWHEARSWLFDRIGAR